MILIIIKGRGAYARGDFNNSSDVDIMILTDCTFEEIEEYRDIISDIFAKYQLSRAKNEPF